MDSLTREGLSEPGVGVAPPITWRARPVAGATSPSVEHVIPRFRRPKATRCSHCDYCRPHGGRGGVRLCRAPGRAGDLVVGDQMACGQYQPVVQ